MVLLNYLFPLFFIIFSLGELVRFQIQSAVSVGLLDIVLVLIITVWLFGIKKNKYKLKKPIILFILVGVFSLLINFTKFSHEQLLVSSLYLFRFIFYAFLYFIFVDIGKTFEEKISKYLTITGIIILIIGFLQFIFYPSLRGLFYLGWDEHLYRLFSSFLDPNFTGVILVLFFVFVFVLKDKLFRNKLISHTLLFITFVAIVLTYSRGALLMFVVCVLTYCLIQKNYKLILATIGTFILVFIILSPRFYLENTNLLRTVSSKERIETSVKAFQIFQKNPLGVGFDTYRYAREKYGDKDKSVVGPSHSGAGVDNSLIFVLVTTGIPGIIAYVLLLYKMFKLGLNKVSKNKFGLIFVVSLSGLIINSLFINSLFYSFIMIWIWILAGLTESSSRV